MAGTRTTFLQFAQPSKGLSISTSLLLGIFGSFFRISFEKPHLLTMSVPRDERVGRKGTPMAPAWNRRLIW